MSSVLLALILLAAGLLGHLLLADARRVPRHVVPSSDASTPSSDSPASTVSIVIPARNESASLPTLLTSLRSLSSPPRDVVVVDDSSDDGTSDLARAGGASVVSASAPPPGWTGKAWACHLGASATHGTILLFLDADTALEPDALDGLLQLHDRAGGLVSVQPYHQTVRAYEQLSAYFNVMSLLASGAFARRRIRHPMAFGPALITSRADYDLAGGHAAVRSEILDDARLAAAYTRVGLEVTSVLGGPAVRMRMYPGGPRQMVEGWTKNIASGAAAADRGSALAAGLWLASHWAVTIGAVLSVVSVLSGLLLPDGGRVPLLRGEPALWIAAWLSVCLQMRAMLRRVGSFRWWTWALFPVPLLAFSLIFTRSVLLTTVRREVTWRGRTVTTRPTARREVR